MIEEIIWRNDPEMQVALISDLAEFAAFFGRRITVERLVMLVISCMNNSDPMLRVKYASLKCTR